jgi:hypothetical protein
MKHYKLSSDIAKVDIKGFVNHIKKLVTEYYDHGEKQLLKKKKNMVN